MTLQFFQIAKGGNYERLPTQTKAAPMDRPGAENHREHNNYILLCVLINSHIVGAVMDKDLILEIKKDLKTIKFNRPYINQNQLIAIACVMQDVKNNKHIDFALIESIYKESNK